LLQLMSLVEDLIHEMQDLHNANEELQHKMKELTIAVSDFIII